MNLLEKTEAIMENKLTVEEKKQEIPEKGEKEEKTLRAWKGIHTKLLRFTIIFYCSFFALLFLLEFLLKLPTNEFLHSHLGVGGTHLLFRGMYLGLFLPFFLGIGNLWVNSLLKVESHWRLGRWISPIVLCGLFSLIGFLGYNTVSEASRMEDDLDRHYMLITRVDDSFGDPSGAPGKHLHRGEKVESRGEGIGTQAFIHRSRAPFGRSPGRGILQHPEGHGNPHSSLGEPRMGDPPIWWARFSDRIG